MQTIKLGQKVKFKPFDGTKVLGSICNDMDAIGEITYINEENRWFQITYGKHNLRRCYNFVDVGVDVHFISDEEAGYPRPKNAISCRCKKAGTV
jgi:hypothetical protein